MRNLSSNTSQAVAAFCHQADHDPVAPLPQGSQQQNGGNAHRNVLQAQEKCKAVRPSRAVGGGWQPRPPSPRTLLPLFSLRLERLAGQQRPPQAQRVDSCLGGYMSRGMIMAGRAVQ
jgi:hypothetical protein